MKSRSNVVALDLNSTKTRRHVASEEIIKRIDAVVSLQTRADMLTELADYLERNPPTSDDRPGRSISASNVGDTCARRVQYGVWPSFHPDAPAPKKEPPDDKARAVFARGHQTEEWMAEWLQQAGFELSTRTIDRDAGEERQHGFITADGQIKGYADGRILLDAAQDDPFLWEHKTLNAKGWRACWTRGLAKAYPHYDAQVQFLMAYLDAPATLVTVLNAETGELYAEIVPFSQKRAQEVSDRAVWMLRATRAGELLPRVANDPSVFPCKWCRFRAECWPGAVD